VTVTGPTRELACLALGHDDTGEVRCPATDEQLMRELVAEVQRLRVAAGEVEETATDRAEVVAALDVALTEAADEWATGDEQAPAVLAALNDSGWILTRPTGP
jgi:hypothetical protein